jgi:hypothetical protein
MPINRDGHFALPNHAIIHQAASADAGVFEIFPSERLRDSTDGRSRLLPGQRQPGTSSFAKTSPTRLGRPSFLFQNVRLPVQIFAPLAPAATASSRCRHSSRSSWRRPGPGSGRLGEDELERGHRGSCQDSSIDETDYFAQQYVGTPDVSPFITSSASAVCCFTSPALGRRSGYHPPIPPKKRRCPERIGPPADCFLGDHDPCAWAA